MPRRTKPRTADTTGIFKLDELSQQSIERKANAAPLDLIDIGQRCRAARKQVGIKRDQLAQKLQCADRYLLELELGANDVDIGFLARLAELLESSVASLLIGRSPTPEQAQTIELAGIWSKKKPMPVSELLANLHRYA